MNITKNQLKALLLFAEKSKKDTLSSVHIERVNRVNEEARAIATDRSVMLIVRLPDCDPGPSFTISRDQVERASKAKGNIAPLEYDGKTIALGDTIGAPVANRYPDYRHLIGSKVSGETQGRRGAVQYSIDNLHHAFTAYKLLSGDKGAATLPLVYNGDISGMVQGRDFLMLISPYFTRDGFSPFIEQVVTLP